MSEPEENKLLDSSNLCIPEDAFEQFQVNSMYEEEEFITLSDLVSPEPEPTVLVSSIGEIPYDNEVVLSSNVQDQIAENQPGTNDDFETKSETVSNPEPTLVEPEPLLEETKQRNVPSLSPKKRGRRQKNHSENPDEKSFRNGDTLHNNSVAENKNEEPNTRIVVSRHGRKIKQKILDQNEMDYSVPKINKTETKKRGRKRNNEELSNELPVETEKPVKQSRKKGKIEECLPSNNEHVQESTDQPLNETVDMQDSFANESYLEENMSTTEKTPQKRKQRGRAKRNTLDSLDPTPPKENSKKLGKGGSRKKSENITIEQEQSTPLALNTDVDDLDDMPLKTLSSQSQVAEIIQQETSISDYNSQEIQTGDQNLNDCENSNANVPDEDGDDVSLSKLKATLETDTNSLNIEFDIEGRQVPDKDLNAVNQETIQNISDFLKEEENGGTDRPIDDSLLVEDTSKRPRREKSKKIMHYDEDSDEDPFANVVLSDDEPNSKRKGKKYYSDDEYVPEVESKKRTGKKKIASSSEDSALSELEQELEESARRKRKRIPSTKGLQIKVRNDTEMSQQSFDINVTTIPPPIDVDQDDIEGCLQSSVIHTNETKTAEKGGKWGNTNEFENFIARKMETTNCKIKKVSSKESSQTAPLEIPVLKIDEKKTVEMCCQTNIIRTSSTGVQTSTPYEIPMKNNVALTIKQSEDACAFLTSIVKTTSELGQLMTQKSDDFINKKINTANVTDTFKMDYCVRKSFLLLKLAKHNIVQMEEDLSKQYEEFLKKTDLLSHRQEQKIIAPKEKDDDSDCEIIEEPAQSNPTKPKFNPKTVFLNKELSIKIAKKTEPLPKKFGNNKLKIEKSKNTVWLSDSVMMKKVNPNQSFLAQDGRNKKPPDCYVTEKMVSDFFEEHYKQQASLICAPFTSKEWLYMQRDYVCCYFVVKPEELADPSESFPESDETFVSSAVTKSDTLSSVDITSTNPESLLSLCTKSLKKHMNMLNSKDHQLMLDNLIQDSKQNTSITSPSSLFRLCINVLDLSSVNTSSTKNSKEVQKNEVASLKLLCQKKINELTMTETKELVKTQDMMLSEDIKNDLIELAYDSENDFFDDEVLNSEEWENNTSQEVSPLKTICLDKICTIIKNDVPKKRLLEKEDICTLNTLAIEEKNHETLEPVDKLCSKKAIDSFPAIVKSTEDSLKFDTDNEFIHKDESRNERFVPKDLKALCYVKVINSFPKLFEKDISLEDENALLDTLSTSGFSDQINDEDDCNMADSFEFSTTNNAVPKSLFSLCLGCIQREQMQKSNILDDNENILENTLPSIEKIFHLHSPDSLKCIAFQTITKQLYKNNDDFYNFDDVTSETHVHKVRKLADICFDVINASMSEDNENTNNFENRITSLTINSVNTVSEEAFHNMEGENDDEQDEDNYYDGDDYDSITNNGEDDGQVEESNWVSQVKLKVVSKPNNKNGYEPNEENIEALQEPIMSRIKLEPLDDLVDNVIDTSFVKTEPIQNFDEMTVIPESIVTKQEIADGTDPTNQRPSLQRQDIASFDRDIFENFVMQNKMMHALDEQDGIFSQSALRVRRQHEPDYNNDYDPSMSLLIPQTFEPMNVESAKGSLMQSSSDEESNSKKVPGKKKPDKRLKAKKAKKVEKLSKEPPAPEVKVSDKVPPQAVVNEVAVLTRRMREKIRQEEMKVASSESEEENLPLNIRKDRGKKDKKNNASKNNEKNEGEIQCNDVDSTEQVDNRDEINESDKNFTGFSAVDQNEICSYQKYVKYVYDQIIPKVASEDKGTSNIPECSSNANDDNDLPEEPIINYDDPVEMLQCEPTMPTFDESDLKEMNKPKRGRGRPKSKQVQEEKKCETKGEEIDKVDNKNETKDKVEETKDKGVPNLLAEDKPKYKERDGWSCYPVDPNDAKLYQKAGIFLEKLPESFVQTYFAYQDITYRNKEDAEVDRLINLNTLNRSVVKEGKKVKGKSKTSEEQSDKADIERPASANSDHCAELTASEDEGANVDDEVPPDAPFIKSSENNLAKNSLMNESDSDDGATKIKQEPEMPCPASKKKSRNKPEVKTDPPESLTLTADKTMNKELNMLHAPVVLDDQVTETKESNSKSKRNTRSSRKRTSPDRVKNEEDSSSEEEKQWVSTKEKLLKRMGKRQETASVDDAKRAKIVSEFIERRSDAPESRKRGRGARGRRRCSRKRLEREKQMRILQHELYGTPVDPAFAGPRHAQFSQSFFKGRRNIRKVIDKKSLARSTVVANMEEFERKCRLNQRQANLREVLGVEEGVNVLVINDEVCLEYGFEEQRPLVTVHPFFTKVMKAHQYEGVKFMWDACFESLEKVESGHGGGGCILAHCMGLGKTLQVLALLHTVLTHPRVGMQRVLVCCPLSTVLNWVDEIHKWIGPVTNKIKVFELSKLKKTYERAYQLEDWYNEGGIFIIGYELFRSLTTLDPELDDIRPTIVNKIRMALLNPGPDIIVCDEGHLLKNDCSVLAIAMSRVATKRRIVLTGTPMQNNLREYYCMVNFIKPNLLGTYSEYSNRFENPIMNGQHRDSQEEDIKLMKQRTHILHKVLEGCLQRQEASVLYPYLPKKHEYTVFISLTKVQWDLYKHYINSFDASKQTKQSMLRDFHTLQKIWSHPHVLHNFQTRSRDSNKAKIKPEKLEDDLAHEDLAETEDIKPVETDTWWLQYLDGGSQLDSLESSNKFLVVFRILDECIALGDKLLLFSTSLITLDSLEYFLKKINKWSLGQEYYRLDGSVPPEVRQKWCREFNAEHNVKTKLFLISTRAGSLGLNMVAANRVILFDTSWNPAHDIQSIFRVYRFGQKKDCYIYRLVAMGTMEQKIYERAVTKQAVACRVVDEQQIDRHYNMAELTELYKYDESGAGVSGGVAVGVCDVALLRVARLPALHAVHEHDSLLRGSSEHALPEHERNAAWMQFQQEQHSKQVQNHLTSSISLHNQSQILKTYDKKSKTDESDVKVENTEETPPQQPEIDLTGKKRKKGAIVTEPVKVTSGPSTSNAMTDEEMVAKITNLLFRYNYHSEKDANHIAKMVFDVRRIVATRKVPKNMFGNSICTSIQKILNMNKNKSDVIPKRGRPRKCLATPTEPEAPPTEPEAPPTLQFLGRRKAAVNAEKQMHTITSEIENDDWREPDEDTPIEEPSTPANEAAVENIKKEINTSQVTCEESILLSDDEAPAKAVKSKKRPRKVMITDEPKKVTDTPIQCKKEKEPEIIPLHPSLLSNNNFIKIVAHTYLNGNPMLDEDAATLAAQYSALRAKKDFESSGKPIVSGPIYDIAIKVLGIDILKKLHESNPVVAKPSEPETVKEATKDATKAATRLATKDATNAATKLATKDATKETPTQPLLKAKGIAELTGKLNKVNTPAVVPVGLVNRQGGITASESFTPHGHNSFGGACSQEESILPDDDDVIVDTPAPAKPIFRSTAKPIVLKAINSKLIGALPSTSTPLKQLPKIPKLIISGGKLLPSSSVDNAAVTKISVPTPKPQTQNETVSICLDSDEDETIIPNEVPKAPEPAKPSKRVAVKSTAKLQKKLTPAKKSDPPSIVLNNFTPGLQTSESNNVPIWPAGPVPVSGPVPISGPVPVSGPVPANLNALLANHGSSNLNSLLSQSNAPRNIVVIPVSEFQNMQYLHQMSSAQQQSLTTQPLYTTSNIQEALWNNVMTQKNTSQSQPLLSMDTSRLTRTAKSAAKAVPESILPTPPNKNTTRLTNTTKPIMYASPESILPTPAPAPALKKTTLCKPGDILRVNKSGQLEVIRRDTGDDDAVTVLDDDVTQPASTPATKSKPPPKSTPAAKPSSTPTQRQKPGPASEKSRTRKISISSSSSDSSRPNSPENNDPLSILKDVVHIQAPTSSVKPSPSKPQKIGNTSISRTTPAKSYPQSKKPLPKPGQLKASTALTPSMTTKDITSVIAKTDTILKKLDTMLGPSTSATKTAPKKPISTTKNKFVDLIDLDSFDANVTKKPAGVKSTLVNKPSGTKTVVGTSKDIIISKTGKAQAAAGSSSSNAIRVTNVETLAPSTSKRNEVKKRPAPVPEISAIKKKKTEVMTLKDFDIDDIDDIIELD